MTKYFLFFLLLMLNVLAFGQLTSNKGTDFWVAYAGHIDAENSRMTLFLSSDVSTSYTVKYGNTTIAQGNIVANVVTPVFINPTIYNVYVGTSNQVENNKAIHVSTGNPISLYCIISNNARTGGSLILPTSTLEQEYYVFSEQNAGSTNTAAYSEFTLVGVEDNTLVDITPTQTDRTGARLANTKFQITLNKGDIYQYQAIDDLTGSRIQAVSGCKPIAVFSGNTWTAYCEQGSTRNPNGGDNLYQQLFPVTAWGKNFVSAPFFNTLNGNTDIIKIIVAEDNTTITVNGSTSQANGTTLQNPYAKGSVIRFYTKEPSVIKASAPIAVAQYQTSQTCNLNNDARANQGGPFLGDPEMTILNPIEQTLKDITVYSKLGSVTGVNTNILKYYLNIIIKTSDIAGFTLDGSAISSQFKPLADGEYSYAVVDVTNTGAQHRLIAAGGFVAIAYGYGQVESYAYLAGTDLKNLRSNIAVFKSGSTVSSSNFCLGTGFDFTMKIPYATSKITWNLNNGAITDVVNNPSYTTKVEDGTTYYLYNYALPSSYFASAGSYKLLATIQKPASATCTKDEEIFTTFDIFAPDFTLPNSACVNTDVAFSDSSPNTGGNIKTWLWDFGDGKTSVLQHPKHKFLTAGLKTVTLTVTTDLGCSQSVSKTIQILASPKSDFTATGPFCVNSTISFTNTSTFVNSDIATQWWDFGNGTTLTTTSNPNTTYTTAGTYKVKLISQSSAGCADTVEKSIVILDPPQITFDDPGSCVNDEVVFEAKVLSGQVQTWLWDFGDGTNDLVQKVLQNPKHKYSSTGTYLVKLIGVSAAGCSTVFSRSITISGNNPTSLFVLKSSDKICANQDLIVENRSSISFGNITKIEWIYDYQTGGTNTVVTDNAPVFRKTYTHRYPNSTSTKTYKVVMRVYSGQLCFTETAPISVTVYPAPVIKFEAIAPVCENFPIIQLAAAETNGVSGTGSYSGSGVSASGRFDPAAVGPGSYPITYTFVSNFGCEEKKTINIEVKPLPSLAAPDELDILWGGQKIIDAKATGQDIQIKWTPADGLSADNVINPIASPKTTTTYTLTITTATCELKKQVVVRVHDDPVIPNVFSPNGDGKNDTWNIKYLETWPAGNLSIFNRYGQKVFYASPYTQAWDGKFAGKEVPVGVYYYVIEPNNQRDKKYSGSVTVLR